MYLIESINDTQVTRDTENVVGSSPENLTPASGQQASQGYEEHSAPRWGFDQMVQLRALFLGLIKQKRWIYFLNESIKVRASHLPVLQVKLKEHQYQFECICRIATSGHSNAIVLEKSKMSAEELRSVQLLCIQNKVQLVLLENLLENDTLH